MLYQLLLFYLSSVPQETKAAIPAAVLRAVAALGLFPSLEVREVPCDWRPVKATFCIDVGKKKGARTVHVCSEWVQYPLRRSLSEYPTVLLY